MQEKESIMGIDLRSAFSTLGIPGPCGTSAGVSVPSSPVIPRVENADHKSMPIIDSDSPPIP